MLTPQELKTLSASPLFHGYTPKGLNLLLEEIPWEKRQFAKGDVIYAPDQFRKELIDSVVLDRNKVIGEIAYEVENYSEAMVCGL